MPDLLKRFIPISEKKQDFEIYLPDLIDVQLQSFDWFLQADVAPDKRKRQGLERVFQETFSIESPNEDFILEYVSYDLADSKCSVQECRDRGISYARPLNALIRLISVKTGEVREQSVYIGDIPIISAAGSFVVNGAERVVVSQLHRSPGIFFFYNSEKRVYTARLIPYRGSWLELELDLKGVFMARIDRKKKFPVTLLLKAMGVDSDEKIFKLFYKTEKIKIQSLSSREMSALVGRRFAQGLRLSKDSEFIVRPGERVNEDNLEQLRENNIQEAEFLIFPSDKDDVTLINSLEKDGVTNQKEALMKFYGIMRSGDPFNEEAAKAELDRLFFSEKSYDLGSVGRYKINNKFKYHYSEDFQDVDIQCLRREDIFATVRYFINLVNDVSDFHFDDIDHLGNRRVRSVGELLMNQTKIGFARMERVVKERMIVQDVEIVTPQMLISVKPIMAAINEFFGASQLSQFMDQINPLAELTHKRRLSALGPGGLSRDRAGFEVRDVHYSHYGRMCPIETPEGPNIGLIVSMSAFSRINEYGFLETPYRRIRDGLISDDVEYLTADIEEHYNIAQANVSIKEDRRFVEKFISCRRRGNFPYCTPKEISYMDLDSMQIASVSTVLIPFLQHDDANRALMGSNMQRQSVPLLETEAPFVGTGMERRVAYDSRACMVSPLDGVVAAIDAKQIKILADKGKDGEREHVIELTKFRRSNQGTCVNQIPKVSLKRAPISGTVKQITSEKISIISEDKKIENVLMKEDEVEYQSLVKVNEKVAYGENIAGQRVKAEKRANGLITQMGSILADGPAIDQGRLALGKNVLVAFMPWEGYNFEDAILVSERLIREDVFTSVHIEEYMIQARETKLGLERITRDVPYLSDKAFRDLDENGVIRIGAEVKSDDILVGMVTPEGNGDLSPEHKLLHAIFGEKAREVRDSSLRVPNGVEGVVIDIRNYSRSNGDELPVGIEEKVKVYVAIKRKLQVGDKMAGRHGNKGVISKILPEESMPYLEDGTPIEIILNPLGVPSRMNIGQIFETQLGFAAKKLGVNFTIPVFEKGSALQVGKKLKEADLPADCKFKIFDGRNGKPFEGKVFCGYIYMLKLAHLVDDKIHSRSTGPYSLVTQQPLGGKAQFGGQRLGEMEVWALEAYGAAHTLQELLTVKADDMIGRSRVYEAILRGIHTIQSGIPESFNVLIQELRGLALDVTLANEEAEEVDLEAEKTEDGQLVEPEKIKLESIERND